MTQQEHIESKIRQSELWKKLVEEIQISYQKCLKEPEDENFTDLLMKIEKYCSAKMRKHLSTNGVRSQSDFENAKQEAQIGIWQQVLSHREKEKVVDNFAYYASGIYMNKANDVIARKSRMTKKSGYIYSLDSKMNEDGLTLGDLEKDYSENPEVKVEKLEKQKMFGELFPIYCEAMMQSKAIPPRGLALYYARVLPHLLNAIPDTKGSSAKWAYERMGTRTLGELKVDSERNLQVNVNQTLAWGQLFVDQLEQIPKDISSKVAWKECIYTEHYAKGKIEDWADSMHKTVLKDSMNLILYKPDLMQLVKDHISQDDVVYRFVSERGGK